MNKATTKAQEQPGTWTLLRQAWNAGYTIELAPFVKVDLAGDEGHVGYWIRQLHRKTGRKIAGSLEFQIIPRAEETLHVALHAALMTLAESIAQEKAAALVEAKAVIRDATKSHPAVSGRDGRTKVNRDRLKAFIKGSAN